MAESHWDNFRKGISINEQDDGLQQLISHSKSNQEDLAGFTQSDPECLVEDSVSPTDSKNGNKTR